MNFTFQNIHLEFDYNSPVIITYLFLSLAACFFNFISKGKTNKLFFTSYPSSIWNPLTYLRLFTHAIGHKDFDHLVHNFLFILLIGPMIEEKYGSIPLIIMFLITSLVIALFNLIFNHYSIVGASGNVYMLIVLSSFSNITEGKIPLTLILILIFYVFSEIKKSLLEGNRTIYHDGHLIGAIMGIVFGFYFLYLPTLPFINEQKNNFFKNYSPQSLQTEIPASPISILILHRLKLRWSPSYSYLLSSLITKTYF